MDVYVSYSKNIPKTKLNLKSFWTLILMKSVKSSGSLTVDGNKNINAGGSRYSIWYNLCKIHQANIDAFPPFSSILSLVGTPTYKIINFLVPILNCLTINEFNIKDSFSFANEIVEQDSSLSMGRLDMDSLFTNIQHEWILPSAPSKFTIKMIFLKT